MPNFGFGYLCNVRIRSAGEIMNYFDFYAMQADSLHACVPISIFNSFSTKMLVKQVGHVTIDIIRLDIIETYTMAVSNVTSHISLFYIW